MSVNYKGKSPNKAWYAWQNTKAIAALPFRAATRPGVKSLGVRGTLTGVSAALAAGSASMILSPLMVVGLGGLAVFGAGAAILGKMTLNDVHALKRGPAVTGYVRAQENKWFEYQSQGGLKGRVQRALKAPLPGAARLGIFLGYGAAAVGGLGALALGAAVATSVTLPATLPVLAGMAAAAIVGGAALGTGSFILRRRLKNAPAAKVATPPATEKKKALPSAGASFQKTAAPEAQLSPARQKAAEIRAQRHKLHR